MLTVSVLLAVLFTGIAIRKGRGLPESVSAMVYTLPVGGYRWLWTVWLWLVAMCLAPKLMETLPEELGFVGFMMLVCLIFVGAMPLFDKENGKWHNILGISAGILSQLCVLIICPWWLLSWLLMAVIVTDAWFVHPRIPRWYDNKGVFIAEAICTISLYGSLV